ncbi:hypothetical protein [Bacillus sp. Marseille-Q3570]|uniref:hypothetical protein n=1 Tax=Bacillus sp. Marseille-Q3570 TaxID=2963522 RepID=UPI0021B8346B|nr:hypothetical protein [Bacillus sp. Marseille-Q3570]
MAKGGGCDRFASDRDRKRRIKRELAPKQRYMGQEMENKAPSCPKQRYTGQEEENKA